MGLIEDRRFYVYVYLDPTERGNYEYEDHKFKNLPFYIGKGKDKRMFAGQTRRKSNLFKYNKIQKLKRHGLKPIALKHTEYLTEQETFDLEKKMIKTIGRRDKEQGPLTNLDDGGLGCSGYIKSEEFKKKLSEASKGENGPNWGKHLSEETKNKLRQVNIGKHLSEETKRKLSEANKGKNHPNWGKHLSQKTIDKIRKSQIGKKLSEEHKRKIGDVHRGDKSPMYGKHPSEETRRKMSIIRKKKYTGKNHPMYGVRHTPESIEKMRNSKLGKNMGGYHPNARSVIVENKYYDSMAEALRDNNISKPTFYNRLKRHVQGYGYTEEK